MSETDFREKPIYPVVFVIILSLVFVGVLAAMFRSNEKLIDKQRLEAYQKAILSTCADTLAGILKQTPQQIMDAYPQSFDKYIKPLTDGKHPRKTFAVMADNIQIAWVFDITGKGLWGTIRALVATNDAQDTILGLNIYDQMETPGLGARVEEPKFSGQFKHKTVIQNGRFRDLLLIPEDQAPTDPGQINQVTGATITSNAVINMLRDELTAIISSEAGK